MKTMQRPPEPVFLWGQYLLTQGVVGLIIALCVVLVSQHQQKRIGTCLSPVCQRAQSLLDSVAETNLSPCHDFYGHVCGNWRNLTRSFDTYVIKKAKQGVTHTVLSKRIPFHSRNRTSDHWAVAFLKTCTLVPHNDRDFSLAFYVELFGINIKDLQKASNETLLQQIVRASARFTKAMLNVRVGTGGDVLFFSPGTTLRRLWDVNKRSFKAAARRYLRPFRYDLSESEIDALNDLQDKLEGFSQHISNVTQEGELGSMLRVLGIADTDVFLTAIKTNPHTAFIDLQTPAVVTDLEVIKRMLTALYTSSTRALYVFLMSFPRTPTGNLGHCIIDMLRYFSTAYLQRTLLGHQELPAVNMMSTISLAIQTQLGGIFHTSRWLGEIQRKRAVETIKELRTSLPITDVPFSISANVHIFYDSLDVVFHEQHKLAENYDMVPCFTSSKTLIVSSEDSSTADRILGVCPLTPALWEPFIYPSTEQHINYATYGFRLAAELIQLILADSSFAHTEGLRCLLKTNHLTAPARLDGASHHLFSTVLGLAVAYQAMRKYHPMSELSDHHALERMFFQRACLTLCEDNAITPVKNSGPAPRVKCNAAVRNLPAFAAAFGCTPLDSMTSVGVCDLS